MDERRIADWYQKIQHRDLSFFCLTLLADRASAEDALQETFLKACAARRKVFTEDGRKAGFIR